MTCKEFEQLYPEVAESAKDDNGDADADDFLFDVAPKNWKNKIKRRKRTQKDTQLLSSSSEVEDEDESFRAR